MGKGICPTSLTTDWLLGVLWPPHKHCDIDVCVHTHSTSEQTNKMVKHDHFGLTAERQNDGQVPSSWETGMWRKPSLHQLCFIALELFWVFVAPPNNKTLSSCTSNPTVWPHTVFYRSWCICSWKGLPATARSSLYLSVPLPASAQLQAVQSLYVLPWLQSQAQVSSSLRALTREAQDEPFVWWQQLHFLPWLPSLLFSCSVVNHNSSWISWIYYRQRKPWLQGLLVPLTVSNMDAEVR